MCVRGRARECMNACVRMSTNCQILIIPRLDVSDITSSCRTVFLPSYGHSVLFILVDFVNAIKGHSLYLLKISRNSEAQCVIYCDCTRGKTDMFLHFHHVLL